MTNRFLKYLGISRYDVFISYRREGGYDTAKHIYDLLTRDGYKVCFDIDTLRNGDFNTQLLTQIEECNDFILIVDQNAFDRTIDINFDPNKDWLRRELAHALKCDKNIIPIFLSGISSFPNELPNDIIGVTTKNGPEYSRYYFNDFYTKLKKRFLSRKSQLTRILYILAALLLITSICFASSFMCKSRDSETTHNMIDGHEYVDLGLSVKWATTNLGANVPCEIGDYYTWGGLEPYGETNSESPFENSVVDRISGYIGYDTAMHVWGTGWRMPTQKEFEELINKCTWIWETSSHDGVLAEGYKVVGPNGNSIFLPVTGHGPTYNDEGLIAMNPFNGTYWSGDSHYGDDDPSSSTVFYFLGGWPEMFGIVTEILPEPRFGAHTIRPVVQGLNQ